LSNKFSNILLSIIYNNCDSVRYSETQLQKIAYQIDVKNVKMHTSRNF